MKPARVPLSSQSPAGTRTDSEATRALREVEDVLGETLADIDSMSGVALARTDDPRAIEDFLAIRQRAVEGLEDLQAARDALTREQLRAGKLVRGLRELTRRFQTQTRIFTELRLPMGEPAPIDEVAWALYAVADEALESLERRSRATGVVLILQERNDEISLSIRDDGVGLLARQDSGWRTAPHAAIRKMRRSMEGVGGVVNVTSVRPRGLLVRAVVPLGAM